MHDNQKRIEWDTDESLDLRHLWNVIDRRKWLIIGFAVLMGIMALVAAMFVTPVYRATATILIESEQANVVSIEEVYGLDTRNQQYFETQFAILGSRPIAEDVVDRLGLANRMEIPTRRHDAGWLESTMYAVRLGLDESVRKLKAGDDNDSNSIDSLREVVKSYQERLEIEPQARTQLVNIHFHSPDRDLATEAANAHAQAYIDSILDARLAITQSASSWMSRRVADLRQKLAAAEARLQNYREEENLIDAQGVQSLPTKEINELSSRLLEARRRLSDARIAYQQVQSGTSAQDLASMDSVPAILRDTAVRTFHEAQAEAERKVAELAKRYGPLHPKMQAAQSELKQATENLRRQQVNVASSIEADYRAAQSDVRRLQRELDTAKGNFQVIGRKQARLSELEREVEVDRQLYDMFYNRMQETAQTGDLESVNARLVSPAVVPILPASPRKRMLAGLVFAASLLFGVIAAFLDESHNHSLRSSQDIEDKLGLPMLGMLPILEKKLGNTNALRPAFLDPGEDIFAEAIRTVRTGLSLSSLDRPCRIILITSSVSDEGKSIVALNLACAFAQMEKTLLIDCDLRRPTAGEAAGLTRSQKGLTDVLYGRAGVDECIVHQEELGLDILAAGFIPPNPLELLSSIQFADILGELRDDYDRIIIDSPPVLPVSDSLVLSRFSDTAAMVIKADSTSVQQVRHSINRLDRTQVPIAGVILNHLDFRKAQKYSDYGYGGYYESYGSAIATTPVPQTEGAKGAPKWRPARSAAHKSRGEVPFDADESTDSTRQKSGSITSEEHPDKISAYIAAVKEKP